MFCSGLIPDPSPEEKGKVLSPDSYRYGEDLGEA